MLPDLAAKASPAASTLIRTIAKQLNVNRREILINNFKYIFSHLVCSCTKDELERALHYLKVNWHLPCYTCRLGQQLMHSELSAVLKLRYCKAEVEKLQMQKFCSYSL